MQSVFASSLKPRNRGLFADRTTWEAIHEDRLAVYAEGYDVEDIARLHHADAASGRINKYNPRHHSLQGKGSFHRQGFESFRQLRFQ